MRNTSVLAARAACAIVFATLAASPVARADETETRIANAYRRFHEAEQLFEAKRFDQACAAFEESQRLDPTLGTLLNMAYCHETIGNTATAWREYNDAAAWASLQSRPDREKFALDRATDLAKRLSRVQLDLPVDVEGIAIEVDKHPQSAARATSILFLDPGDHVIRVTAPGKKPYEAKINVAVGPSSMMLHVPSLMNAVGTVLVSPTDKPGPETPPNGTRTAGLVVVGVGIVGLGLGTYFGVRTLDQKTTGRSHCDGSKCDEAGVAAYDDAHTSATVSTIAFGAGFVALGAGIWLMLRRPSSEPEPATTAKTRVRPMIGARNVGLGVEGTW